MRMLGFPGFAPTGSAAWLMERAGLSADGIVQASHDLLGVR
jgi:transketolase